MEIKTKQVVEFGQQVTLYMVVAANGWTTLWHSSLDKALGHYERHMARP